MQVVMEEKQVVQVGWEGQKELGVQMVKGKEWLSKY